MQTQYYVSNKGQQVGPYSIDEIIRKVGNDELSPTDYVYVEEQQDWFVMLNYAPLAEKIQVKKSAPKEVKEDSKVTKLQTGPDLDGGEWFVLRGENKFGPFSYAELVKMLQEKSMYEYDYVWNHTMASWQRVAELEDFKPDSIKALLKSDDPRVEEIFFRRRHARASFGGSIIVHDNEKVWKAKGVEISVGGAALIIDNAAFQPGQNLYLHFKPGDNVPPFNASCEIVSKQYVDKAKDKAPVRYGVKFTNISQVSVQSLKDYTKKKAA